MTVTNGATSVPAAVLFSGVGKSYGTNTVLADLDLEVPVGQRVAIIGRSGSGKTTLLRLLMTLERPDSGTITVMGELLGSRLLNGKLVPDTQSHLRKVRANIGMIFQHFNLFPHMTALQNVIEAPIRVLGTNKDEARIRGIELLTMVGLAEKCNEYPRKLSGGQQQRVAIARALALRPKILLFDEVTSALDPELVGEVLDVIRQLVHESGMTTMIVTHEMSFAREVADRVLFMESGRIIEDAVPSVIFSDPQEQQTRRFLKSVLER
jgi:polar amino acid transport system ATP-binding protein